jgi:hypothetical protein
MLLIVVDDGDKYLIKATLRKMAFFGITEYYDETLALFKETFEFDNITAVNKQTTTTIVVCVFFFDDDDAYNSIS